MMLDDLCADNKSADLILIQEEVAKIEIHWRNYPHAGVTLIGSHIPRNWPYFSVFTLSNGEATESAVRMVIREGWCVDQAQGNYAPLLRCPQCDSEETAEENEAIQCLTCGCWWWFLSLKPAAQDA